MSPSQNASSSADELCTAEVKELHQFFEDWLTGRRPETESAFERVERALGPSFRLIDPSGRERRRGDIQEGLRTGYGSEPDLTIQVRDVQVMEEGENLLLATYEEWQETGDSTDGRLSTVLFRRDGAATNGLRWAHVHETWIQ
jgi:hypothetical protein